MEGQLRERMTNCCLPLISFVVKSSLIRDCLAEIALHETQLEQDSQAGLAEEHISTSSHLPALGGAGDCFPSPKNSSTICQAQRFTSCT